MSSSSSSKFKDDIEENNEFTPFLNKNRNKNKSKDNNKILLPWYKTPSIYFILPAFFLVTFTIGLELTARVKFNVQIVCQDYYYSKSEQEQQSPHFLINFNKFNNDDVEMCDIPEIQSIASELMLILNLCSAIPGIFVLGLFGSISDRKGRRIILLLATMGIGLNSLTVILVGNFWEYIGSNYSKYLMLGSLLDGFSGGLLSLFATIHAYAADCSAPKQRSIIFGWIQGVMFMGLALGSVASGFIVEVTDNIISIFYISVILFAIFFLFVLFILPESVSFDKHLENQPPPTRNITNWKQFSELLNIFTQLSIFLPKKSNQLNQLNREQQQQTSEEGQQRKGEEEEIFSNVGKYSLLILVITYFMLISATFGIHTVIFLYTSYVFKWSLIEQGYYILFAGISRVVILALFTEITRFMKKRMNDDKKNKNKNNDDDDNNIIIDDDNNNIIIIIDEKEKGNGLLYDVWVIRLGLIIDSVAFLIYGLATNSMIFVLGGVFGAFGIIANSTIRSVQTNLVPSSQVGQLLGAISVIETIARIIAPVIFNSMYSYLVVTTTPNVVWYAISGILFFGVILMFLIVPKK